MKLSDYQPSSGEVLLGAKGSFKVKGLDFDDLQILVSNFLPDLELLWEMISEVKGKSALESAIIIKIATEIPALLGEIIALSTRVFDPEATQMHARALPFPVQVRAMETISRLTFEEFGGPKVFVGFVKSMIENVKMTLPEMMTNPTNHQSNGSIEG